METGASGVRERNSKNGSLFGSRFFLFKIFVNLQQYTKSLISMKKFFLILAAAAAILVSCSKDKIDDFIPANDSYTNTVTFGGKSYPISTIKVEIIENKEAYSGPVFIVEGVALSLLETDKTETEGRVSNGAVGFGLTIPVSNLGQVHSLLDEGDYGSFRFGSFKHAIMNSSACGSFFEHTAFGYNSCFFDGETIKGAEPPKTAKYYLSIPVAYEKTVSIYAVYEDAAKNRYVLSYKGKY